MHVTLGSKGRIAALIGALALAAPAHGIDRLTLMGDSWGMRSFSTFSPTPSTKRWCSSWRIEGLRAERALIG